MGILYLIPVCIHPGVPVCTPLIIRVVYPLLFSAHILQTIRVSIRVTILVLNRVGLLAAFVVLCLPSARVQVYIQAANRVPCRVVSPAMFQALNLVLDQVPYQVDIQALFRVAFHRLIRVSIPVPTRAYIQAGCQAPTPAWNHLRSQASNRVDNLPSTRRHNRLAFPVTNQVFHGFLLQNRRKSHREDLR